MSRRARLEDATGGTFRKMVDRRSGTRTPFAAAALVICLLAAGCAVTRESTVSGAGAIEDQVVDIEGVDDLDVATDLDAEELGVDAVLVMSRGNGRPFPDFGGPGEQRRAVQHILSIATPMGRVDLFSLQVLDENSNGQWMQCEAIAFDTSMGMGCSDLGAAELDETGIVGSTGSDEGSVYELRGPSDTAYFIIESDGDRIAVVPVDGRAIFFQAGAHCVSPPQMVSVRVGDVDVDVSEPTVC